MGEGEGAGEGEELREGEAGGDKLGVGEGTAAVGGAGGGVTGAASRPVMRPGKSTISASRMNAARIRGLRLFRILWAKASPFRNSCSDPRRWRATPSGIRGPRWASS